jgi:hypothetical protein
MKWSWRVFLSPKVRKNWIINKYHISIVMIFNRHNSHFVNYIFTYLSTYPPNIHSTFDDQFHRKEKNFKILKTYKLNWFWRVFITKSEKQLNRNKYHIWNIKIFKRHTCHIFVNYLLTYLPTYSPNKSHYFG